MSDKQLISRSVRRKQHKRDKWIKIARVVLALVLFLMASAVVYGFKVWNEADNLLDNAYKPRKITNNAPKINPAKEPVSILILGIDDNDERNLGSARTDSMLVATVSPEKEKINLVSIPRDTYTYIEASDYSGYDRINTAYSHGREEAAIEAVEGLLDIPINYYVTIDFQAFEKVVDSFGGVEIDVPFELIEQNAFGQEVVHLEQGLQDLDGEQALAYVRTRKLDNDVMRGKRQQEVLEAVAKKALKANSIPKYKEVMSALDGHFWTDMEMNTVLSLAESGLAKDYQFNSHVFSWIGFQYYGADMVALHQDSLDHISHLLRVSLGLELPDERDQSDYKFETDGIIAEKTFPHDGMAVLQ